MKATDFGYGSHPETGGFLVWILGEVIAYNFEGTSEASLEEAMTFLIELGEMSGQVATFLTYGNLQEGLEIMCATNQECLPFFMGNPKPTMH